MHTLTKTLVRQRSSSVGLAILSLVVPLIVIGLNAKPFIGLNNIVQPSDERLTVVALMIGIVCGVCTLFVTRGLSSSWLRWLSATTAVLGGLVSLYLIWNLIGSCGMQVIWDVCRP